jgi:serine/threonine-protein kinase HipA
MNYRCLSTLKPISHEGFSPSAQARLSGGSGKVPFRLSFTRSDIIKTVIAQAERMSISGVQDKISLKLEKGELVPVVVGGEYILKPIPSAVIPFFQSDVPANEHLTMQIAEQVFKIRTAVNACVYLKDGEMAYVTKRFDRVKNGGRILQEDFCQLSERSADSHGENFKYEGSYEELGGLLKKFSPAYPVEIEKLFKIILFNYIFSNGDAHLKNFSLYRTRDGDHILTPAYDLLCTSMHFSNESRTALELFDDFESEYFKSNGFYGRDDFAKLAKVYGMRKQRAERFIQAYADSSDKISSMVERSFLSDDAKNEYISRFYERLKTII